MATLADLFSLIDSQKRKLGDVVSNPIDSLMQAIGNANDQARNINEMTRAAANESAQGKMSGPASMALAEKLAESYNPAGMIVYHGSPFRFGQFDAAHMGKGEGAQAFGYGHYFASDPNVSKGYVPRDMSYEAKLMAMYKEAEKRKNWNDLSVLEEALMHRTPSELRKNYGAAAEGLIKKIESIPQKGSLYKVDLPDDQIAKMLDWDKPLSEQPEIMKLLTPESMGLKLREPVSSGYMAYIGESGKPIGLQMKGTTPEKFREAWLKRLQEIGDLEGGAGRAIGYLGGTSSDLAPTVSGSMRQAGIPGIRYLEQGNRGTGQGTSNFVVFPGNESLLKMLEINDKPMSFWGF